MLGMPGMRYVAPRLPHRPGPVAVQPLPPPGPGHGSRSYAVWYLRAQSDLAARGRRWRRKRTLSFLAGLVALDLALQSPVATFTMEFFQAHVIQHLLLMVVAPPPSWPWARR